MQTLGNLAGPRLRLGLLVALWFALVPHLALAQATEPATGTSSEPVVVEPQELIDGKVPRVPAVPEASRAVAPPLGNEGDLRTVERVRFTCGHEADRRDVTLFGNGTVRVRVGLGPAEKMGLAELAPERLAGYLARLGGENLDEVRGLVSGLEGPYLVQCHLRLALARQGERRFEFGRFDSLPLALARVLATVEEIAAEVTLFEGEERLPDGYEAQIGDRLRRGDGAEFEVVSFTVDGNGVELRGLLTPLTIYVPRGELRRHFSTLVAAAPTLGVARPRR